MRYIFYVTQGQRTIVATILKALLQHRQINETFSCRLFFQPILRFFSVVEDPSEEASICGYNLGEHVEVHVG